MDRIVIVGGSVAGVHAAESLRELGFEGDVVLVSAEDNLPYDRPPLSKEILLGSSQPDEILLRPTGFYQEKSIELRLGVAAVGLDTAEKTVHLADKSHLSYDGLVLATGSSARHPRVSGRSPKIHLVRSLKDAAELRTELIPGRRLVVVGGGFVALEVASAAAQLGLDVSIVARGETPLAAILGEEVGQWYADLHERHGVTLYSGRQVAKYEETPDGVEVTLTDGTVLHSDILVAGIGATPAVEWLESSTVQLSDGVLCSPSLLTSAKDVVAAGDIVKWRNPLFDEEMRIEHWSNAADQGRHAAKTLLGDDTPFASVPYFWTDQYDTKLRFVGRATGRTDVRIEQMTDTELVVSIGRNGVLIGAVCVGAPRLLAHYKVAIQQRTDWMDAESIAA